MIQGFYVYIYSDPRDGEAFYVGKGKAYRAYKHLHQTHSRAMRMKLQQLAEAGVDPAIEVVTCESEDRALQLEALFIATYGRRCDESGSLFNILESGDKPDGFKGRKHSEESRAKISAAHKGRPKSEEMKAKMRVVGLARDVSHLRTPEAVARRVIAQTDPGYRARMSETQKERKNPEHLAAMTAKAAEVNRGTRLTPEHRAAISEAMKNRVYSAETRAKMSAAQKRRYAK